MDIFTGEYDNFLNASSCAHHPSDNEHSDELETITSEKAVALFNELEKCFLKSLKPDASTKKQGRSSIMYRTSGLFLPAKELDSILKRVGINWKSLENANLFMRCEDQLDNLTNYDVVSLVSLRIIIKNSPFYQYRLHYAEKRPDWVHPAENELFKNEIDIDAHKALKFWRALERSFSQSKEKGALHSLGIMFSKPDVSLDVMVIDEAIKDAGLTWRSLSEAGIIRHSVRQKLKNESANLEPAERTTESYKYIEKDIVSLDKLRSMFLEDPGFCQELKIEGVQRFLETGTPKPTATVHLSLGPSIPLPDKLLPKPKDGHSTPIP